MASSQKYRAEKLAPLQERLVAFVQGKLESEEIVGGRAPSAQPPAPDIPLDEEVDQREDEVSSLQEAAAESDGRGVRCGPDSFGALAGGRAIPRRRPVSGHHRQRNTEAQ